MEEQRRPVKKQSGAGEEVHGVRRGKDGGVLAVQCVLEWLQYFPGYASGDFSQSDPIFDPTVAAAHNLVVTEDESPKLDLLASAQPDQVADGSVVEIHGAGAVHIFQRP